MSLQLIEEKLDSLEKLIKRLVLNSKDIWEMEDVMELLGVSKKTLYKMMREKKIPAYRPVKGKAFFIPEEIKFWITSNRPVIIWSIDKLDNPNVDTSDLE